MINKKKAELSINMIVIVAICLVVLVVLIFLVTSRGRSLDTQTKCTSLGGVCKPSCTPESNVLGSYYRDGVCNERNPFCCNPLG